MLSEVALRIADINTALVGPPVLLPLALRRWLRSTRVVLPAWRNGLGLSAFTLVLFAWVWFVIEFIAAINGKNPIGVEVFLLTGWLTVLALILASAWKGSARLEVVGACLLMLIGYHFYFYV